MEKSHRNEAKAERCCKAESCERWRQSTELEVKKGGSVLIGNHSLDLAARRRADRLELQRTVPSFAAPLAE